MIYNYNNFLRPITESDKSIKILDDSNDIKYTIDPFVITNISVISNILRINLKSLKVILLSFSTKNEAQIALTRLQQQIDILTTKVPLLIDKDIYNYIQYQVEQIAIIGPTGATGPVGSKYYSFSDITSSVISGTYTVTDNDFQKTLIYTGGDNINLLLTSSLTLVEGTSITLLQKGSGQITIVGSGVSINTTSDVVATTYGQNSLVDILVYSTSISEVIVSGKLKST